MSKRLAGAFGDRKSGIVFGVRRGLAKKFHGPFSDAHFLDVSILARTRFVGVLKLANQRERRFGAYRTLRKSERLSVLRKA
jgi:hypothetical protein